MPRFSKEERTRKAQEKQAEKERQELAAEEQAQLERVQEAEDAFWESPAGQARSAKAAGQRYLQIQIPITSGSAVRGGPGDLLTQIETEGWQLIESEYVFHNTGRTNTAEDLEGGSIHTSGVTMGVYLFRSTPLPPRSDRPWLATTGEPADLEMGSPGPDDPLVRCPSCGHEFGAPKLRRFDPRRAELTRWT